VRANNWDKSAKIVALATSLRGRVCAILDGVVNFENLRYSELESRLKLHFGEGYVAQTFIHNLQIRNRNSVKIFLLSARISDESVPFGLSRMFYVG